MAEHTYDSILSMIYATDPEVRQKAVFRCDPRTQEDLWRLMDEDGRFAMQWPMNTQDVLRLFGYRVLISKEHDGLTFGPES